MTVHRSFLRLLSLVVVVFLSLSIQTKAATYTWNGAAGGNWLTATNWSPFGVPGAADNVRFTGLSGFDPVIPVTGITVTDFIVNTGGLLGGGFNCNGATLTITGTAQFNAGTYNNGNVICSGGTTTFGNSTFNTIVSVSSGAIVLNGTTFNNPTSLTKTGATTDVGDGGNVFNSTLTIINNGTGILRTADNSADDFNDVITITNSSSGGIDIGYNSSTTDFSDSVYVTNSGSGTITFSNQAGETQFNDYIELINTGTGVIDFADNVGANVILIDDIEINSSVNGTIRFGLSGGTSSLASTKKIVVGTLGFSVGSLYLKGFTQLGTTAMTINLTGTANLDVRSNTVFNADLTATLGTGTISVSGATFQGETRFTSGQVNVRTSSFADSVFIHKTSTGNDDSEGGNTFSGPVTLINSGGGELNFATISADTYSDSLSLANTNGGSISLATAGVAHTFQEVYVLNSGTGNIEISNNASSTSTFNQDVSYAITGTGDIEIASNATASVVYNENVTFENTGTGSALSGTLGGSSTLASNKTITIGSTGFSNGILQLYGLTQNGTLTQNINMTGGGTLKIGINSLFNSILNCSSITGRVHLANSTFQDTVIVNAPDILLNNSTYNQYAEFNFNGTGSSISSGGNTYNAYSNFNNTNTGSFIQAMTNADTFNDSLLINNSGNGTIAVAHNTVGNTFSETNILNSSGGDVYIGNLAGSGCTHNGTIYANNSGSGDIYFNHTTGSASVFNCNIELTSTGSGGIYFGENGGTGTLATTYTIYPSATGISSGIVSMSSFTQNGTTTQTLTTTGSGKITIGAGSVFNADISLNVASTLRIISAIFNGEFDATAFRFLSSASTYNQVSSIDKTGSSNDYSDGGNTFNDSLSVTCTGTGILRFANVTGDDYNGFVEFHWVGGTFEPAYTSNNTFASNILIDGVLTMDIEGVAILDGNNQTITMTGVDSAYFNILDMSSATGTVITNGDIILPNPGSYIALGAAVLDLNGYELIIHNDNNGAITRTSGYILTEQTDNSSQISWDINSDGSLFTFPLGNSNGVYIPYQLQVTAGDVGTVSVATYGTTNDNLPLPSSPEVVSHIYAYVGGSRTENSKYTMDRFWQIDKTGAGTVTMTFSYDELEIGGTNTITESNLFAQRWNSAITDWDEGIGSVNTASNTVTVTGVSSFSPWTLVDQGQPLPVEWLNFEVNKTGEKNATISWTTISEEDNDFFTVERSSDTKSINIVEFVESNKSSNISSYEITDYDLPSGVSYYRIKQTDINGDHSYTDWQSIDFSDMDDKIQVYVYGASIIIKNSSNKNISLNVDVSGMSGKIVLDQQINLSSHQEKVIDTNVSTGLYMLILHDPSNRIYQSKKVTFQ